MRKSVIILYIVLTLILAISTFIDGFVGSGFADTYLYGSWMFVALWAALLIFTVLLLVKNKVTKRLPLFLLHISFVIILLGGLVTFVTGKRGTIYLRQGVEEKAFFSNDYDKLFYLPFTVRLDTFLIDYYPGTNAPKNYTSKLTISTNNGTDQMDLSMNSILKIKGYRFYQSSFDADHTGSWLTVNNDPLGIGVTYSGYILFFVSFLWSLFSRKGEFIALSRHPLLRKGVSAFFLFLSVGLLNGKPSYGKMDRSYQSTYIFDIRPANKRIADRLKDRIPVLSKETADSLRSKQVIYNDRVVPFNTLARDVIVKIYGKPRYMGLTPEQAVESLILYPEEWNSVPIIEIKNRQLRKLLGIDGKYACLTDFFENERYKLEDFWLEGEGQQNKFYKAVIKTDEKIGLIFTLRQGELIRFLSENEGTKLLSQNKIKAELLYNSIPFGKLLFIFNLTIGLLAFFWTLFIVIDGSAPKPGLFGTLYMMILGALLFHSFGLVLRCIVAGRLPLSNGYETMQFLAWCIMLFAYIFRKRSLIIVPAGFLLSGFTLLVSYLGQMDPAITPLMPVLLSPWLSLHVSVIMMSYALFSFIFVIGIVALILHGKRSENISEQIGRLMIMSRLLLFPALLLLGTGIFIGAIWANLSWGRYWGWDPKEVWALITFMVYSAALHNNSVPAFRKPKFFNWYLVLAFVTVIMTYFGVNWLGGMHSY